MTAYYIQRINFRDHKQDGTPLIGKNGKPFWVVGIQISEYPNQWINGILPFCPDRWEHPSQKIDIYEEDYQGKPQMKFRLPPRDASGNGNHSQPAAGPPAARSTEAMRVLTEINRKLDRVLAIIEPHPGQGGSR